VLVISIFLNEALNTIYGQSEY